ncbi:MAG: hypothetical protein U0T73_01395 [Chitinophagales bacterium]
MKFIIAVISTAVLAAMLQSFFPWYVIVIAAFAASFFVPQRPAMAFFSGFLGVALLWCSYALIIDHNNNHILTPKIAELLHLPGTGLLFLITAVLGGLVSGLAALSASFIKPVK